MKSPRARFEFLNTNQVSLIRRNLRDSENPERLGRQLARHYGVSKRTIDRIWSGV